MKMMLRMMVKMMTFLLIEPVHFLKLLLMKTFIQLLQLALR